MACCKRTPSAGHGCTLACTFKIEGDDYLTDEPQSAVYNTEGKNIVVTREDTGYLEGFPLSTIHPDLEELIIKKLDVRRNGERLYGWQKVGTGFGIGRDDLKYLENAYKKDGGSPTKELLDMLICQGRKVSDLVNVLKSPHVNYPDVALLIYKEHIMGIH